MPRSLAQAAPAALLLLAVALVAPARAGGASPGALGLPALARTVVAPPAAEAPLRLSLHGSFLRLDPSYGIDTAALGPDISAGELRAQLSVRASRRAALAISMPWRRIAEDGGEEVSGAGDLRVGLSTLLLESRGVAVGAWGSLSVPTGEPALSTGEAEGEAGLHLRRGFFGDVAPRMHVHANVGWRWNKAESQGAGAAQPGDLGNGVFPPRYPPAGDGGTDQGSNDMLLLRTALEFERRWAHLFLELSSDWLLQHDGSSFGEGAHFLTPGVHLGQAGGPSFTASWSLWLGADDAGTAYEPRLPDWQLQAGASWPLWLGGRDRDDDGIPDGDDLCPDEPEDLDGFQDEDGCPDYDNDGDGIPDRRDLAPNVPEDFDGYQDEDGRPELDNDNDGIADADDLCPNQPEDYDGFEDTDGCPDIVLDADGDGIEDAVDRCPRQPEDVDGFQDEDGCPDPDNDLDGIPDARDACPDEPEDYDGYQDDDGCPEEGGLPAGD